MRSGVSVAQSTINGLYDGVDTHALDTLAAETAMYMSTDHPDYATLAARIATSNLHKTTEARFSSGAAEVCGARCAAFVAKHAAAWHALGVSTVTVTTSAEETGA